MVRGYYIYDRIQSTEGQQVFHTSRPYLSGTLMVYLNGLLVDQGETNDYIEVDNTTIEFNYKLTSSDEVMITSVFSTDKMSVEVVGNNNNNPTSLYKKYSKAIKFKNNNKYHVNISLNNKSIKWSFTSKYAPLYCTVDKIRLDTGDLLNEVTDEKIYYMIYLNSKEVQELIRVKNGINGGVTSNINTTFNPSIYTKAWVRYKTCLDLVNSAFLSLCSINGSTIKKIGVIDVERHVKLPVLKEMLGRFKELFMQQDEYIRKTSSIVNAKAGEGGS